MESPLHNVGGWLARRAWIAGDRLAVVGADRSLTYLALEERTGRCAAAINCACITPPRTGVLIVAVVSEACPNPARPHRENAVDNILLVA